MDDAPGQGLRSQPIEMEPFVRLRQTTMVPHCPVPTLWSHVNCNELIVPAYLDLSIHGDGKQGDKVHDQDWPEDGHVEQLEEGAHRADDSTLGHRVPELELGQTTHKRLELAALRAAAVCGQLRSLVIVQVQFRVDLGREEGDEQVQVVDAQRVRHDVPALFREDAQQEQEDQHDGAAPSNPCVRCQPVQLALVYLQGGGGVAMVQLERERVEEGFP